VLYLLTMTLWWWAGPRPGRHPAGAWDRWPM